MAAYLFQPTVNTPSYDYGSIYNDIENRLEQIEQELSSIEQEISSIDTTLSGIAASLVTIAANSTVSANSLDRIKDLGEGPGFRIKSPYEIFSMAPLYKLLIEEGKILELEDTTEGKKREALNKIVDYMREISNKIPKEF